MCLARTKRCSRALALAWVHTAALCGLLLAQAAPAATTRPDRYSAWRAAAAQSLGARKDADSLAAAAALSFLVRVKPRADPSAGRAAAVEMAARASELDPEDTAIGWLRLELCAATQGCDIRDPATTMRWVDADNGAVWLATLAAAQRDRDAGEVTRVLQEMGRGTRFDVYRNRTVVMLFDALKKSGADLPAGYVPSDLSALSEALAVTSAEIVPPFAPLIAACRESSLPERRDSCLKLSRIMQRGDAVSVQMAGFTIERHLSPDGREARAVAERRRILEWRVSAASEYDAPALPWLTNALARERVREMRAAPREEDVDIAILRKHKIPLEPPEIPR